MEVTKAAEKAIKGLECCACGGCYEDGCPYNDENPDIEKCTSELCADALVLIQKLQARIEELEEAQRIMVYQDCLRPEKPRGEMENRTSKRRCETCAFWGKPEELRCDHPNLEFDIECYDHWIQTMPNDYCSYWKARDGQHS